MYVICSARLICERTPVDSGAPPVDGLVMCVCDECVLQCNVQAEAHSRSHFRLNRAEEIWNNNSLRNLEFPHNVRMF